MLRIQNPILKLALPNILSNITVPLVGMVDLALMGHLGSEVHLNAIAIGASIFSFIYLIFNFLRTSTTGFVAQAYGAHNKQEQSYAFGRAISLAVGMGMLMIAAQWPIGYVGLWAMGADAAVNTLAQTYFNIRILAAPATLGLYVLSGWFIGMQNTKVPLLLAVIVNLGNIGFNLLFIKVFAMQSEGVALGTLIAQYVGFVVGLGILWRRHQHVLASWRWQAILQIDQLQRFFSVNRDIFIRSLVLISVLSFFTAASARMGQDILAVNTLLLQFFYFFTYFMDGFANAAEALVGKEIGAKAMHSLKSMIKKIFAWAIAISMVFSAAYVFFGNYLLSVFTDMAEIHKAAQPYFIWIQLLPIISFAAFIWDGVYIGAIAAKPMRNTMLISGLFFFPVFFLCKDSWGNHALWLAFNMFLLARGLLLHLLSGRHIFGHRGGRYNS